MRITRLHRGLATVEFVMVLPVLMLFAVLIIKSGEVTIQKISANVNARRTLYEAPRGKEGGDLPNRSLFSKPLGVKDDGTAGLANATGTSTKPISLRPVISKSATYNGKVACLLGTWDHKSIEFPHKDTSNLLPSRLLTLTGMSGSGFSLGGLFNGNVPNVRDALKGVSNALGPVREPLKIVRTALGGVTKVLDGIKSGIQGILGDIGGGIFGGAFDQLTQGIRDAEKILELVDRLLQVGNDRLQEDF
jgi:hypothetical protein